MSTKAIRAALQRLAEYDDGSAPGTLKALSEVQAIEKAAKAVLSHGHMCEDDKAVATLESIAKDAP